jgi:hypothetical protein
MAISIVEQKITVVQRFCKTGNKGLSGDRCATTAHALSLAILEGALAQKRARAIRPKHIFVDMMPALPITGYFLTERFVPHQKCWISGSREPPLVRTEISDADRCERPVELTAQSGHSLDIAAGYFDTAFCFSATDLLVS